MIFSQKYLGEDLAYAYTTAIHESAQAVDRYLSVNTLGSFDGYASDVISRALKRLGVIRSLKKSQRRITMLYIPPGIEEEEKRLPKHILTATRRLD